MASAHELPDLPVLPPLTLSPQHNLEYPSVNSTTKLQATEAPSFLKSPAMSFADSFTTAYTSLSPGEEEFTRLDISSFSLSHNLKNSVAVDPVSQNRREDSGEYSTADLGLSSSSGNGNPADAQASPEEPAWSSRHRGESFSSLTKAHDLERDEDRYDPIIPVSGERFRNQSLQSQDGFVRGGDLPLPSRTPIDSISPPAQHEQVVPSILSSSSLQAISSLATPNVATSGRARSGSLGYNAPNFSKRTVVNTYPMQSPLPPHGNDAFVLAVIGTPRCGKTTVIRKGLSGHGLVESIVPLENLTPDSPRYIRRTGQIDLEKSSAGKTSHVLEVIEIDVQTTNAGLLKWPQGLPPIDGVIICYDASDESSYRPVEGLLKVYRTMILPVIVLGCKTDLIPEVNPGDAQAMLKQHDTGLIEVSHTNGAGKEKMKKSFQFLLKAVCRQRGSNRIIDNRNPASEQLLSLGADTDSWTHTPTIPSSIPSFIRDIPTSAPVTSESSESVDHIQLEREPVTRLNVPVPLNTSWSAFAPTTTNEISLPSIRENLRPISQNQENSPIYKAEEEITKTRLSEVVPPPIPEEYPAKPKALPRPSQWADIDALLDKLLFLAVSGDDPTYARHFLLTHRRFSTPRSVLLAMQKRMRLLDDPSGDPMFAVYAQMRICNLLETWIKEFPYDFAVKGTTGALVALIKSIISKTHLLHYGSEFLPFLEQLPSLVDQDTAWALKVEVSDADSDVYSVEEEEEEDEEEPEMGAVNTKSSQLPNVVSSKPFASLMLPSSRDRKSSLPLPRSLLFPSYSSNAEQNPKQHLKDLTKLASEVLSVDAEEMAQEITRQCERGFLKIRARDWMHYTFASGKNQNIIEFNTASNHLADWVVSLILCHDRAKHRARQVEKFADIAQILRRHNNYSALRAFVAGINNSMDDETTQIFRAKSAEQAKNLKSWDVLLQTLRSHRSYRMALRNSKGSTIPALEVHLSDLIKTHEGNSDKNEDFPTKIPWGKYNLIGRFIVSAIQCQTQCRNSNNYNFPDRPHIAELFVKRPLMSDEMQQSRLKMSDDWDDQPVMPHPSPDAFPTLRKITLW